MLPMLLRGWRSVPSTVQRKQRVVAQLSELGSAHLRAWNVQDDAQRSSFTLRLANGRLPVRQCESAGDSPGATSRQSCGRLFGDGQRFMRLCLRGVHAGGSTMDKMLFAACEGLAPCSV